ncbi:11167_t:CDS:2 [Diversispora eburnea]|uniref:11167_t:CDS:1 n=1 Tax=Diversispora eburnea TaxID=1213867 RepID=A0A9N8VZR0_9GLOM|nr:11167_t:CDS:2 [Diversispora eburnea]
MSKLLRRNTILRLLSRKKQTYTVCLPADCLYDIFNLLKDDIKSLHSCILVNRLWCETAVPYLWAHPFTQSTPPPASLINIFIANLSDADRNELITRGIRIPSQYRKSPTFNYASFIPHLSMEILYTTVHCWTQQQMSKRRSSSYINTVEVNELALLVYCSLCRLFFGKRSNIQSLNLDRPSKHIGPTMPNNLGVDLCLSNIKNLSIRYTSDTFIFGALHKQAENVENLSIIKSSDPSLRNFDDSNYLSSLIFSQHRLRSFSLSCYDTVNGFSSNIFIPLASQADTLTSLKLYGIPFPSDASIIALTTCLMIEELEIKRCTKGTGCLLESISRAELPYLRKVRVIESSTLWGHFISTVIQKNPLNLEEVFYQPWEDEENNELSTSIIKSIAHWSPKLKTFGVVLSADEVPYLIKILSAPGCRIEKLSLFSMGSPEGDLEKLWPEVGKHIPVTLKHLNIWIFIGAKAMHFFLKNIKAQLESLYIDAWVEDFLYSPYSDVLGEYLQERFLDMADFFHPEI